MVINIFAFIACIVVAFFAGLYFGFRQGIKFYIKKVLHYLESKYPKEQAGWELVKIINTDTE